MMTTRTPSRSRKGTFLPFLALSTTAIFGLLALAIDLGMMTVGRTECQNAADASALIGSRILSNRSTVTNNDCVNAISTARAAIDGNIFVTSNFTSSNVSGIQVGVYDYDTGTQTFSAGQWSSAYVPGDPPGGSGSYPTPNPGAPPAGKSWSCMRVTVQGNQPTFFAKIFGYQSMSTGATAVSVHRPRDVAIILDFSVSMRFGSMSGWMGGMGNSNDVVYGTLNPDPNYPQFGHYGRYTQYVTTPSKATMTDTTAATAAQSAAATSRPNPMYMLTTFTANSGEVHAPNNVTVETPGGPPVVMDFRFDPRNRKTPSVKQTSVAGQVAANGTGLWNAFHRWFTTTPSDTPDTSLPLVDQTNNFKYSTMDPPVASTVDNTASGAAAVVRTFNWANYNAFDLDSTSGPVPAPDSFATQSASGSVAYVGDVYPGKKGATASTWDPTVYTNSTTSGPAIDTAEFLGWGTVPFVAATGSGNVLDRGTTTSLPTGTGLWGYEPRGTAGTAYSATTTDWSSFRDAAWERYGYDLDVVDYVANRAKNANGGTPPWDPRWDWRLTATGGTTNATTIGWLTGGTGNTWQHNMKTVTGDTPTNKRTVPPDSTATTGTGATAAQSITFRPKLKVPGTGRLSTFNGYSMGPGYYGKTFWMWPPDPRFGVQDPKSGATTAWPDVTAPDWPALSTATLAQMQQADPAFSTNSLNAAGTATAAGTALVPMCDWRRRFFIPLAGSETVPSTWFDPQTTSIDQVLFSTSTSRNSGTTPAGVLQRPATATFKPNYRAILAWITTGPQVLPTNLRAGRIVYYTSIPTNCDSAATDADQRFWRDYIDYVVGYTGNTTSYNPEFGSAGVEYFPWPEGSALSAGAGATYPTSAANNTTVWTAAHPTTADIAGGVFVPPATPDPKPYSNYTTNPNRPRQYFWFGPVTMIDFLANRSAGRLWWPGTCHEAQCWQLKAAMNSALTDIQANHPNDFCGLTYFANINYTTPRVPMGQKWTDLRNALFYNGPKSGNASLNLLPLLNPASGSPDTTTEIPPFDPTNMTSGSVGFTANRLAGILPNANGGTDPNTGMATAFNMLSSASSLSTTDYGTIKGRLGAAKIVIYQTDGVPTGNPTWGINGGGTNTYYTYNTGTNETYPVSGLTDSLSGLDMTFASAYNTDVITAIGVVQRIVAPVTTNASVKSGFSLPNTSARVYPIGFGDLFTGYDGTNTWAGPTAATNGVKFLLRTGQAGNTLPATSTATLPTGQVISGSYQNRITNLRNTLQTIMQSGVQVTLIE